MAIEDEKDFQGEMKDLTTAQGVPIPDDRNSLKIGDRGPTLLEDFPLREKIFHFDHERIPERVVHARGFGVRGYFELYQSLSEVSKAHLFQKKGEKTPVFVRFSTVLGSKGSFDLARDVRGFAVKFYTKEGNWDLVGNNIPVFFIQDAIKFPDIIHAGKPEPDRDFPQAQTAHTNFWDFISLTPESMHMIMWIMSDRAIPRSFRFMEGFGVHTFRLVNSEGKSTYVKFHWKPKQGLQSVKWEEAVKINGADPDFHRRDLWEAIEAKNFPEWELGLQLFDDTFAERFPFDILDATKLIPEEEIPIRKVGRLVLNQNVDNFFAETEQVAFCTQNIVAGIDFTNDPLLQGRNFSYLDTQTKRLGGPNFTQLPVNAPKCPRHLFQQDGHMAMQNPKGRVNYNPNSWLETGATDRREEFHSFPTEEMGTKKRFRPKSFSDHYSQARQFYLSQTPIEQRHIIEALIFELSKVEKMDVQKRMVSHLLNIEEELALKVAKGLGLNELPLAARVLEPVKKDLKKSPALSILLNGPKSFKGRKLALFMTEGANEEIFMGLKKVFEEEGAFLVPIGLRVGPIRLNKGEEVIIKGKIEANPSALYDAIALLISAEKIGELYQNHYLREFVLDAFFGSKIIGYEPMTKLFLSKLGFLPDRGCIQLDTLNITSFLENCRGLRYWERDFTIT